MKIFYKTRASATGGRTGRTALSDGTMALDLASPGGNKADGAKTGANPEQLFAMGYAACFDSALNHVAKIRKLPLTASRTDAEVGIGQLADGGFKLDIDIYVEVTGLSEGDARDLVEATHHVCPYSNATRNNIDVRLHVATT